MANNFYVIEKRHKITADTMKLSSDRFAGRHLLMFKLGACKCTKQDLNCHGVSTASGQEFSGNPNGANKKSATKFTCIYCGYVYDACPNTILYEDYLALVNKKLEIIQVKTIDLDELDPVWRMVQKKCGKDTYSTTEQIYGLDKLRYYYPGKQYFVAPSPEAARVSDPLL